MALEDFKKALKSTDEIEITVTGRRPGRETTRPVWFVQDADAVYLVPVKGSDSEWYKNVAKNPTIPLAAKGIRWTAKATPITDPAPVRDIVERFRTKYGAGEVKKYYSTLDVAVKVPLA